MKRSDKVFVQKDDIRHREECRQSGDNLCSDVGAVFLELKEFFQERTLL